MHSAVIIPKGKNITNQVMKLIGLAWEYDYTRWRHGPMNLKITDPRHPICLSMPKSIHLLDEAYWPLKGDLSQVTAPISIRYTC